VVNHTTKSHERPFWLRLLPPCLLISLFSSTTTTSTHRLRLLPAARPLPCCTSCTLPACRANSSATNSRRECSSPSPTCCRPLVSPGAPRLLSRRHLLLSRRHLLLSLGIERPKSRQFKQGESLERTEGPEIMQPRDDRWFRCD
jgi:hypothetical protein